jgi:outer membrane protein insertion porin family
VLALLVLAPGAVFGQYENEPDFARVADIRFEGRRHVKESELLATMKTKSPSRWPWADRPVLREDFVRSDTLAIAAAYRRHGYLDARVGYRIEETKRPGRSRVVFEIREGPRSQVASVTLHGSAVYPEDALRRKLSSRPGRPYDPAQVVADTTRISREYQDRGYIPEVRAGVARESTDVHITYDIASGPLYRFGEVYISVAGEPTLAPHLIRRELAIVPGEVYRYSKVERSQEQLVETGFFRLVQLDRLVDSSYARVEWDLRLTERKPRWIDAGVGSGTAERFRFTGEWGNRNLLGRGLQGVLGSRVAFDGEGRFLLARGEASLLEPWLFRTRTRGQITPYYERSTDRSLDLYRISQHRRGVTLRAYRDFGRSLRFQLVQDNVFVSQSLDFSAASLTDTAAVAQIDSALAATEPSYATHRLQAIAERDRRDFPLSPGRGSYQNLLGEVAGGPFQGSSSFLKIDFTSSWYTPLRNGWVLAARFRAGAIDPFGTARRFTPDVSGDADVLRVPIEDRFRLGGVNTVRGYAEGDIPFSAGGETTGKSGGLALLLGNIELRVPVYGPFGLEFFADAGNVWDRPAYIKGGDLVPRISTDRMSPTDVRLVFGFGGRLNLPFGPLRFDVTWAARPEENGSWIQAQRQFAIGPAF